MPKIRFSAVNDTENYDEEQLNEEKQLNEEGDEEN